MFPVKLVGDAQPVIDDDLPEFREMMETYTDTWGKSVRTEILKQYSNEDRA